MLVDYMSFDDIKEVALIEKDNFTEPWSEESFKTALEKKDTIFLVAKSETDVLGYCGCYLAQDEADITNVATAAKHRKKGVATKLLLKLFGICQQRQVEKIFLEVRESNESAINLYTKMGFEKIGIRKNFYVKPTENAIVMIKQFNQ